MADEPEKTEGQAENQEAENQQAESQQVEGKAKDEPKTVPYERFQEVVDEVKQLKEQAEMAAQQVALARANPPQQEQKEFDIFKEVGLEDEDDVPTVKQHRQILNHYATVFDRRLAELAFQQAHPDFAELVGTADEIASGKYAAPLAAAIKQNPALMRMIAKSDNPRLAAYYVAKLQKSKTGNEPIKKNEAQNVIDEAVENANRIKSSANTKGGENLSEEGRIAKMDDKDFLKLAREHGAFV